MPAPARTTAHLLRRLFARLAVFAFATLGASAHAAMSPELISILNEMQAKLVVDFASDPRSRTDCQKEVINIARAAMNLRNIESAAEKSGQILISALEHGCKLYLDLAGLGAIATTYSVAKCFYEYQDDVSNDAGFAACLLGEAVGYGVGKGAEALNVEEVRSAIVGRVTDATVDALKGEIDKRRGQISNNESDLSEATLGDGCEVQLNIAWRKATNPVREQRTTGRAGTVILTVGIRNCKCSLNKPYSQQLRNGSLVVTVPVNFVRNGASQPAWQADMARMRTRIEAQCCSGGTSIGGDPPRADPKDPPKDGPAPGTGGGGRTGGTTTGTGSPPPPRPPAGPVSPPPRPRPTPPAGEEPPKPPVPFATACPECVPLAAAVDRANAEYQRLRGERVALQDEILRHHEAAEDARRRIRTLEKFLETSKGQGGSSFDPETGTTITSFANGDGTVTVTTYARDGSVVEQHTRSQGSHAAAVKEVQAERQREADERVAEAAARAKRADRDAAIAKADQAISAAIRALDECIVACKRKGVTFEEPRILVPGGPPPKKPGSKKPSGGPRKGPGIPLPPPVTDPPAQALCEACRGAATAVDQARAAKRSVEARIYQAEARLDIFVAKYNYGTAKMTPEDNETIRGMKERMRALDRDLRDIEVRLAQAEKELKRCNDGCAEVVAEGPVVSVPGGTPARRPPAATGDVDGKSLSLPSIPQAACEACQPLVETAFTLSEIAGDRYEKLAFLLDALNFYRRVELGAMPEYPDSAVLPPSEFMALPGTQRARRLLELEQEIEQRGAEMEEALAELARTIPRIEACNRRCQATVVVERVVNRIGNNPFDPANPVGPPATGTPQPPPPPPPPGAIGSLQFSSATYGGAEGGAVLVTVTRTGGASGNVSVGYATGGGSATAGADYAPANGTLTWADGDMSPRSFSIALVDDTLVEPAETFEVRLASPGGGATLGSPAVATVSIADNDSAPPPQPAGTLQFSLPTYETAEGASAVTITVTRTGGSSGAASVQYFTGPGSATAGADYQAVNGTLAWAAGDATPKTFTVPIIDDTIVEGPETFFVTLNGATGAALGAPATATVAIQDNDVATGPCGAAGNAWQPNAGAAYFCSGSCSPTPSPQTLTVSGDRVTVSPFHAGGQATFTGCSASLNSDSATLTYFGQSNHRATITRTGTNGFNASIVSSGGGTCAFTCSRAGP